MKTDEKVAIIIEQTKEIFDEVFTKQSKYLKGLEDYIDILDASGNIQQLYINAVSFFISKTLYDNSLDKILAKRYHETDILKTVIKMFCLGMCHGIHSYYSCIPGQTIQWIGSMTEK